MKFVVIPPRDVLVHFSAFATPALGAIAADLLLLLGLPDDSNLGLSTLPVLCRILKTEIGFFYEAAPSGKLLKLASGLPENSQANAVPTYLIEDLWPAGAAPTAKQLQITDGNPTINSAFLAVPALAQGELYGAFIFPLRNARPFPADTVQAAAVGSGIVATGMAARSIRDSREKRLEFLKVLSHLDPDNIEEAIHDFLSALRVFIPARFISFWQANELDGTLVLRAFHPNTLNGKRISFESFDSRVLRSDASISHDTADKKRATVLRGIRGNQKYANRKFAERFGLDWLVSFPIVGHDGRVRGVVNLYPTGEENAILDEGTLQAASLLIGQFATAMELSLRKRREIAVAAYDTIFREMIDKGDRADCWDAIARVTADQMRCDACSIYMRTDEGKLSLKGTTGIEGSPKYEDVVYAPNEGLTGTVFATNKPLVYYRELDDASAKLHRSLFRERLRKPGRSASIVLVPIRNVRGEAVGVIRCNTKADSPSQGSGRFTGEDVLLLETIGDVAFNIYFRTVWLLEKERAHVSYLNRLHHEVIHPIDGMLGYLEWLRLVLRRRRLDDPDTVALIERRSKDVLEAVKVTESLVRGIGYLERTELASRTAVDLHELLVASRSWFSAEAKERGVEVFMQLPQRMYVLGDRELLHRLFYNIFINALKYSDRNERARFVKIEGRTKGEHTMIDISDNGIGVLPEDTQAIFNKEYRGTNAKKVYPQGTGQGLAFCKAIAEAHHGRIELAKMGAKPTVFRVTLPTYGGDE